MPGRKEQWWRRTLRQLSSSPTGTAEADIDEIPQHDETLRKLQEAEEQERKQEAEEQQRKQEAEEQKKREQEIQAIIVEMEGLGSEEELNTAIASVASEGNILQEQIASLQTQI